MKKVLVLLRGRHDKAKESYAKKNRDVFECIIVVKGRAG